MLAAAPSPSASRIGPRGRVDEARYIIVFSLGLGRLVIGLFTCGRANEAASTVMNPVPSELHGPAPRMRI
jgi:hypothetical protein